MYSPHANSGLRSARCQPCGYPTSPDDLLHHVAVWMAFESPYQRFKAATSRASADLNIEWDGKGPGRRIGLKRNARTSREEKVDWDLINWRRENVGTGPFSRFPTIIPRFGDNKNNNSYLIHHPGHVSRSILRLQYLAESAGGFEQRYWHGETPNSCNNSDQRKRNNNHPLAALRPRG